MVILAIDTMDKDMKHGILIYTIGTFKNGIFMILEDGRANSKDIALFRVTCMEVQKRTGAEIRHFGTW